MRRICFACFLVLFVDYSYCKGEKEFRIDYQYFSEANAWFKLHHMPVEWQEARLRCAFEGAMLASPINYGMTAVIKSLTGKHKVVVYTGIHATVTAGDFNSLEGIPFSEIPVRWRPGNPDNQNNNEKCIVYHSEGLMEDVDCGRPFPYICYKRYSNDIVMTECGTTDPEYKLDARTNKCYKIHLLGKAYWVAAGVCTAEGGHLAIINSDIEAEVVKDLLNENPSKTINACFQDTVLLGFHNWHDSNFFGTLHDEKVFRADYQYFTEADGWFKMHRMLNEWQEARLRCSYEGAILASPVNYGMATVIKSLTAKYKVAAYTGIHATLAAGDFNALDGTPLYEIPVKWKPGNPDNKDNNEKCIIYHGDGLVEDVDCGRPFPYICYRKHKKNQVMTECGTIDREYKMDMRTNKCYKLHRMGRPYKVAAGVCTAEGGHLAVINSEVEAEVLKDLFARNPATTLAASYQDSLVLGFYNWHDSNFFGTVNGQSLKEAGYEKWSNGQPNFYDNSSPQRCGTMFRDAHLDDGGCNDNLAFVCEKHPDSLRKSTIDIRIGDDNF